MNKEVRRALDALPARRHTYSGISLDQRAIDDAAKARGAQVGSFSFRTRPTRAIDLEKVKELREQGCDRYQMAKALGFSYQELGRRIRNSVTLATAAGVTLV